MSLYLNKHRAKSTKYWAYVFMGIISLLLAFLLVKTAGLIFAASSDIDTVVTQIDGTPNFTATDGPGLDSSANNQIVRTNDTITYNVEIRVGPAQNDVTFTIQLPKGAEIASVPAFCSTGSSLTPNTIPAPTIPVTMTSYQSLPEQTLVCNIGNRTANSTFVYPIPARVRPEVPNGTTLTLASVSTKSTENAITTSATLPPSVTVSARAQFDLSKNGTASTPNSGYFYSGQNISCTSDSSRTCRQITVPILISAPTGGKGITPLASPITFTDNLTPDSLYPSGYASNPNWISAGASALNKYGAKLVACSASTLYLSPGHKIGGVSPGDPLTATTSVRDSGTLSCTQSGGAGTEVSATITGTDSTAYTYPTKAPYPVGGTALPADKAYVFAGIIMYEVPLDAIKDLGTTGSNANGATWTFNTDNKLENFEPSGIDGVKNNETDLSNNSRTVTYTAADNGFVSKAFIGVPNYPNNIAPNQFNPSNPIWTGPPGADARRSGNISVMPTQPIVSSIYVQAPSPASSNPISVLACDAWDNTKLWLKADNYQKNTPTVDGQFFPSNGEAVWLSGAREVSLPIGQSQQWPIKVYYGGGAIGNSGAASTCDESSSSVGWFTDPSQVPGNDPAKAAQGVYTGVTRVRVYMQMPYASAGRVATISIGQVIADAPGNVGTRVPNYATAKMDFNAASETDMMNNALHPWAPSNYNPANHSGTMGDRLTVVNDTVRITKKAKPAASSNYDTSIISTTGGDLVDFQLSPSLAAAVSTGVKDNVTIEDCLPSGLVYQVGSASLAPSIVQASVPSDANISCPNGATYMRWVLPNQTVNSSIDPITYRIRISDTAPPNTYTNTTLISSAGDVASTVAQRTSLAQLQVVQPSGIKLSKTSLTPLTQVNRQGASNKNDLQWQIELSNINASAAVRDVDVIDVLPKNNLAQSQFSGSNPLKSVVVSTGNTPGQPVEILYSADATVDPTPSDPSNAIATATTTWCNAPNGGTPVIGSGSCPTGLDSVTAFRLRRPGVFVSNERIVAIVTTTPQANAAGNVYNNRTAASADGLLPVGPVDAPVSVVGSTAGDYVWFDENKDGIQDTGEKGIAGIKVNLGGKDDLGNNVSLQTTTDTAGKYLFDNLRSGTYRVVIDKTTLPAQTINTYSLGGGAVNPSDDSLNFTLAANSQRTDVDFGLFVPQPETPPGVVPGIPNTGIHGLTPASVVIIILIMAASSATVLLVVRRSKGTQDYHRH